MTLLLTFSLLAFIQCVQFFNGQCNGVTDGRPVFTAGGDNL